MLDLTDCEVTWIAGLLEGEASFGIDRRSKSRYQNSKTPDSPYIKIAMVDEDVIQKLSKLLQKDYFSPNRLTVTNKRVYQLHLGEKEKLLYLLQKIRPFMGSRRGSKIDECLNLLNQWKKWVEEGGRSEQALYANKMRQLKRSKLDRA